MRVIGHVAGLAGIVLASACSPSGVKSSDSLVGATDLPSWRKLSGEMIQINRRGGPGQDHLLSYELGPDNSLTVTHSLQRVGVEIVLAKAQFRLQPDLAGRARTSLIRIRPAKLTGVESLTRPKGCGVTADASSEAGELVFIDGEERFGISTIPGEANCDTPQARLARQLLSQVLTSLPGTQIAAAFPNG